MPELLLMRHAKSDWSAHVADIDRPLNKRGRQDAKRIGDALLELDCVPDHIVLSSSARTQETVELVTSRWEKKQRPRITIDKELYMASGETLVDLAATYLSSCQRLMLVAHNPGMDSAVSYLADKPAALTASGKLMVTAAVAHFVFDDIACLGKRGHCHLGSLLRPADLR